MQNFVLVYALKAKIMGFKICIKVPIQSLLFCTGSNPKRVLMSSFGLLDTILKSQFSKVIGCQFFRQSMASSFFGIKEMIKISANLEFPLITVFWPYITQHTFVPFTKHIYVRRLLQP